MFELGPYVQAVDHHAPTRPMPEPTEAARQSAVFEAIFQEIKTWDVRVDDAERGHSHAGGHHVQLILDSLRKHGIRVFTMSDKRNAVLHRLADMAVNSAIIDSLLESKTTDSRAEIKAEIAKQFYEWMHLLDHQTKEIDI
jgi:hypothetical protein